MPQSYDELPYPNFVFADTHPSRLAGVGRFFGLNCKDAKNARVLEIGCAGGLNSLSHAVSLPQAEFVAIDAASKQIEIAQELQRVSGIPNVSFHHRALETLDESFGTFDYIICHGVFSWVTPALQHEILLRCRERLSEQGVAYVSYNTLPGWHLQQVIRDALLYRTEDLQDPKERASVARDFLGFAKNLLPKALKPAFDKSIDHLLSTEESYLVHDHLSTDNHPIYFRDFYNLCQLHGLSYLAEVEISAMIPKEFPHEQQEKIYELAAGSLSKMEQYLDFLRIKQFRKTLLCRSSCQIQRNIDPQRLLPLFFRARKSFLSKQYQCNQDLESSALAFLAKEFPRCLSANEIASKLGTPLNDALSLILEATMLGTIEIHQAPCPIQKQGEDSADISPLVKSLIPFGNIVPNLSSDPVTLSSALCSALASPQALSSEHYRELCNLGLMCAFQDK